jgi:hypothetical protein
MLITTEGQDREAAWVEKTLAHQLIRTIYLDFFTFPILIIFNISYPASKTGPGLARDPLPIHLSWSVILNESLQPALID